MMRFTLHSANGAEIATRAHPLAEFNGANVIVVVDASRDIVDVNVNGHGGHSLSASVHSSLKKECVDPGLEEVRRHPAQAGSANHWPTVGRHLVGCESSVAHRTSVDKHDGQCIRCCCTFSGSSDFPNVAGSRGFARIRSMSTTWPSACASPTRMTPCSESSDT